MNFSKKDTQFIKGIAIFIMLFHHCFMTKERWATVPFEQLLQQKTVHFFPITFAPFSEHTVVYLANFSKICVAMFVFLTGYGMAASYKQKKERNADFSVTDYVKERYLNLIKNFIYIFIIVQILSIPTGRFMQVYGQGFKAIIYCIIDGLGLAKILKTPLFCLTWWYMSLAIMLILLFPIVQKIVKKYQWIFLAIMLLLPRALNFGMTDLIRYMFAYLSGILFFEKNLFVLCKRKLLCGKEIWKGLKLFLAIIGLLCIIKCRQNAWIGKPFYDFWDGFSAAYIIVMSYTYLSKIRLLREVLRYFGKHSMNIFLIHSFYRDIFFHKFFYSFYYAWIDYFVLLLVSLLTSIALEWLKGKCQSILNCINVTNMLR